jgi:predicted nucleotidyltransferase
MDYNQINKNSIKIIDALKEGKAYFSEIYEKTGIKSKNNLLKNLNLLVSNKILIKEEKKANTFYSINYSNNILIAMLNFINQAKFERLPFHVKKSIMDCLFIIKPRIAVLFGSYVKGDYKKESDIDLLFFDGLNEKKDRIREISKNYGVQINATFMSFEELDLKSESLAHIFKTGYPLSGEAYFYNEIKEKI